MKKVLIICYYWPPAGGGGVQRWLKFVKYLPEFGWDPVVYVPENADYPLLDFSLETDVSPRATVIRQPIIEPYDYYRRLIGMKKKNKLDPGFLSQGKKLSWRQKIGVWIRGNLFIPDARCLWINPSVKFLIRYVRQNPVDCIISTGPPHSCHVIAKKLKEKTCIPWLADLRDPWTQIDYFNDLKLNFISRYLHQRLERKTLNAADQLSVIGPTMAKMLANITITPIEILTNGYDEADIGDIDVQLDSKFSIAYIGTINDAQNPLVFWEALSALHQENHELMEHLVIRIVGKAEQSVWESIKYYQLEDWVDNVGYVDHLKSVTYQRQSQILLLIINNTWNNKLIVTGKIFEYITSGRPIICIGPPDGDAAKILESTQSGKTFDYSELKFLKDHLVDLYNEYKVGKLITHKHQHYESFNRKNITKRLSDILDRMIR